MSGRHEPDDLNEYNNMNTLSERIDNDNMPLSIPGPRFMT